MPAFATAFAKIDADEATLRDPFERPATLRPRSIFGAGLLLKLARIAGAANEDRPDQAEPSRVARRSAPHLCEFDYDYYVALQSRRRHQPTRSGRRETSNIEA